MNRKPQAKVDASNFGIYILGVSLLLSVGCIGSFFASDGSMPAPVREDFPYEISGIASSQFMGDSFLFKTGSKIHFIALKGVNTPGDGQPFHRDARRALRKMVRYKTIRVQVVGRDSYHREIGFATSPLKDVAEEKGSPVDCDVGLELIRLGLGWYDGADFENADLYRAAHDEARNNRRGLWEQEDPVPPRKHEVDNSWHDR